MKTHFTHQLSIADSTLHVFFDLADFERYAKRVGWPDGKFIEDASAMTVGYWRKNQSVICVVFPASDYKKLPRIEELAGLMAHEAVHVWQACCEKMVEEAAGKEVEAYAIQRIFQWMFEDLLGYVKERKSIKRLTGD